MGYNIKSNSKFYSQGPALGPLFFFFIQGIPAVISNTCIVHTDENPFSPNHPSLTTFTIHIFFYFLYFIALNSSSDLFQQLWLRKKESFFPFLFRSTFHQKNKRASTLAPFNNMHSTRNASRSPLSAAPPRRGRERISVSLSELSVKNKSTHKPVQVTHTRLNIPIPFQVGSRWYLGKVGVGYR